MDINIIMEDVKEIIISKINIDNLDYDDLLLENGVDSMSIIEIIVEIEEVFGIEFDDLNYSLFRSIRSLSEHIEARLVDIPHS